MTGLMTCGALADVVDEEALLHADLRGRQPEPRRGVHGGRSCRRRGARAWPSMSVTSAHAASAPGRRTGGSRTGPRHQASGKGLSTSARAAGRPVRVAAGRGGRERVAEPSWSGARTSHGRRPGPAPRAERSTPERARRERVVRRPGPDTIAIAAAGGNRSSARRGASAAATRSGSACTAASMTSWFGHARLHEHARTAAASADQPCGTRAGPRPPRRPGTRGASSSWSRSRNATASASVTRCSAASVPTWTRAGRSSSPSAVTSTTGSPQAPRAPRGRG